MKLLKNGLSSRFLKCIALALGFLMVHAATFSQVASPPAGTPGPSASAGADPGPTIETQDQQFVGPEVVREIISEITLGLSNALESMTVNPAIAGAGEAIALFILIILIVWGLLRAMIGGGLSEFIEEFIMIFAVYGIVYAILHAGGIQAIKSLIDGIASSFAGSDMSTLHGALSTTVDTSFSAISKILSVPDGSTRFEWTSPVKSASKVALFLLQVLAKLFSGLIIALALCMYAAHLVTAFASIILATALAPIMVPFLMLKPLSFIFDGWLRFFIVACLMKAVGAFILSLTTKLFNMVNYVAGYVNVLPTTDTMTLLSSNLVILVSMVIVAGLAALLMSTVPTIAQGLVSGSGVAAGFSSLRPVTQAAGMRLATSTINGAGAATGKAVGAAGSAAKNGASKAMSKASGGKSGGSSGGGGSQKSQNPKDVKMDIKTK